MDVNYSALKDLASSSKLEAKASSIEIIIAMYKGYAQEDIKKFLAGWPG